MINIRATYVLFNLILIGLTACTQLKKERCHEFNNKYPAALLKLGSKPDTLVLIRVLNGILTSDNKCIDAYLTRGDLYFHSDDLTKAKADYRRATILDTGNIYALYKMGLVFQDEDAYDSSVYFLQLAINKKARGGFLVDYNGVGKELNTNSDKYDVESVELFFRQAVSFYYKNDYQSAFKNFNFCIQNKYRLDKALLYRGAIYLEVNKKSRACEDFLESKKYGNIDADDYIQKYCGNVSK